MPVNVGPSTVSYVWRLIVLLCVVVVISLHITATVRAASYSWEFTDEAAYDFTLGEIEFDGTQAVLVGESDWYDSDWGYRKKITIDHTQLSGDLNNFPLLIEIDSDAQLAALAKADGSDVVILDTGHVAEKQRYVEHFDSATGRLVVWVLTDLSSTVDTEMYLYFGNPTTTVTQATWPSEYEAVIHFDQDLIDDGGIYTDTGPNGNDGSALPAGPIYGKEMVVANSESYHLYFPSITEASNGDWLVTYKRGLAHVNDDATAAIVLRRSSNKGATWSSEVTLSGTPSTNANWQNAWISTIEDRIFVFLMEYDSETNMKTWLRYSDDNGQTWSPATQITSSYLTTTFYQHGKIVRDPSGNLLMAGWGRRGAETYNRIAVLRSTDNGVSWSDISNIDVTPYTGTTTSEPSLVYAPNGDLLLKETYSEILYRSTDHGEHWDAGTDINLKLDSPMFAVQGSNLVFCGRVNPTNNTSGCAVSTDDGVTWSGITTVDSYAGSAADGGYTGLLTEGSAVHVVYYTRTSAAREQIHMNKNVYYNGVAQASSAGPPNVDTSIYQAAAFDGVEDRVNIGSDASLDDLGSKTISAWFYARSDGQGSIGRILDKRWCDYGWQMWTSDQSGSSIRVNFLEDYGTLGANSLLLSSSVNIPINTWTHVAVVVNGSTGYLYINGVEVATDTTVGSKRTDAACSVVVGNTHDGINSFDGLIDEVTIESTVRNAAWILALYQNQSTLSGFNDDAAAESYFPTSNPSVKPLGNSAVEFTSITGFNDTANVGTGAVKHQLSNDGGTTW